MKEQFSYFKAYVIGWLNDVWPWLECLGSYFVFIVSAGCAFVVAVTLIAVAVKFIF